MCSAFAVHGARLAWFGNKKARNGCPSATIRAHFGGHFVPIVATDPRQREPRNSMNHDTFCASSSCGGGLCDVPVLVSADSSRLRGSSYVAA